MNLRLVFLVMICGFLLQHPAISQKTVDIRPIERSLSKSEGIDKLVKLNILTKYYISVDDTQKINRYSKQAAELAQYLYESDESFGLDEKIRMVTASSTYGEWLFNQGNYEKSKDNFLVAKNLSTEINYQRGLNLAVIYLDKIDSLTSEGVNKENFFERTFKDIDLGNVISETTSSLAISSELKLARAKENSGKNEEAINHYKKALEHLNKREDSEEQIREIESKIASLEGMSLDMNEKNEIVSNIESEETERAEDSEDREKRDDPDPIDFNTIIPAEFLNTEPRSLRDLAIDYEAKKDYEKSLEYYKMYLYLEKRLHDDSIKFLAEKELTDQEVILLRQQKEIADLNIRAVQRDNQQKSQIVEMLTAGGLTVVMATLIILFLYFSKRKQHSKLTVAYSDLDKTRQELVEAEEKISTLLKQQVSGEIARELIKPKSQGKMRFVCVMFLDIRDFTPRAETMNPEELIDYQNKVFGFMIDTIENYHGNINQIMGDGFMATFGAPKSYGNDCMNAYLAAREILDEVEKKNIAGEIPVTKVGIGLHAGQVVTGNVGTDLRKQYSVTGNTVIIASRVEQLNKQYKSRLIITEEVYNHVKTETQSVLNDEMIEVTVKGRKEPIRIIKVA